MMEITKMRYKLYKSLVSFLDLVVFFRLIDYDIRIYNKISVQNGLRLCEHDCSFFSGALAIQSEGWLAQTWILEASMASAYSLPPKPACSCFFVT